MGRVGATGDAYASSAAASSSSDVAVLVHEAGAWGEPELRSLMTAAAAKGSTAMGPWIEYFEGAGGVVIAAPHDGVCIPLLLPERTSGVTVRDTGTKGLAAAVAIEAQKSSGNWPHLLVCHLSRRCVDVNRSLSEAASHSRAQAAWRCYHKLRRKACAAAALAAPMGSLFLDIHAQGNWRHTGCEAIELGTLCPTRKDLQLGSAHLDGIAAAKIQAARSQAQASGRSFVECLVEQLQGVFSMPRIAAAVLADGGSFAEMLCGSTSIGARLNRLGYEAVPSPKMPLPPPVLAAAAAKATASSALKAQPTRPQAESCQCQGRTSSSSSSSEEEVDSPRTSAPFFSGRSSYTLQETHRVIDSLQAEFPSKLTRNPALWVVLAQALHGAIAHFWFMYVVRQSFPKPHPAPLAALPWSPGEQEIPETDVCLAEMCTEPKKLFVSSHWSRVVEERREEAHREELVY